MRRGEKGRRPRAPVVHNAAEGAGRTVAVAHAQARHYGVGALLARAGHGGGYAGWKSRLITSVGISWPSMTNDLGMGVVCRSVSADSGRALA